MTTEKSDFEDGECHVCGETVPIDGSLAEFGMETDGTVYRDSRQDVEKASEFGVDDRDSVDRGPSSSSSSETEQQGFGEFGDGGSDDGTLFDY